jgi:hypothetical protein
MSGTSNGTKSSKEDDLAGKRKGVLERAGVTDEDSYCNTCGWCEDEARLRICNKCGQLVCHECVDQKGVCGVCVKYDFCKHVDVWTLGYRDETSDDQTYQGTDVTILVGQYAGIGKHYHITIMPGHEPHISEKRSTVDGLRSYIKTQVNRIARKRWRELKLRTLVSFGQSSCNRKWFYKEGD